MSENKRNDANDAPLKKLLSAEDLRGRKSGTDRSSAPVKKRNLLLPVLALCVALAVAIGIYFASQRVPAVQDETAAQPTTVPLDEMTVKLITEERSNVASVQVENPQGTGFTILNNNVYDEEGKAVSTEDGKPGYSLEGNDNFNLDQSKASAIIGYAVNLTASKMVTENAENLADYGLDAPRATVTMNYKNGASTTWLVGSQAPTSSGSYFMEKGKKAVFLLYSSAVTSMTASRNDLHVLTMPYTIDAAAITDMLIEAEGKDPVELRILQGDDMFSTYSISSLRLVQPFYYSANSDRADVFFNGAAGLTISSYAGDIAELQDTGLEDGGARIKVTVEQTVTSDEKTEVTTSVYRIGNYASADQVYVQVDDTTAVYLVGTDTLSFLDNATPGYLVDQFANLVYISRVDHINIACGDEEWNVDVEHIQKEDSTNTTDTFAFNGKPVVEDKPFRKLYQELIGLTNSKLSDDYAYDGKPFMTVTYTLNVEPGELVVEYLEYDDNYLMVRRDGLTLFLIKKDKVESLRDSLRAYDEGTYVPQG
ncbi:MAG: DUF4340 domain-containing protein [Clostridia bacterium]|nr:DUF4340 domain-containing protein [Clostridia bacterium]